MNLKKIVRKRLGELLIAEGVATPDQIQEALNEQSVSGELLGEILVKKGFVAEVDMCQALCNHFQLPFIQASCYDIPKEIIGIMPATFLHEFQILPLDRFHNLISVVMSGIIAKDALEQFQQETGCQLAIYIGTISDVKSTLKKLLPYGYDIDRKAKRLTKKIKKKKDADDGKKDGRVKADTGQRKLTLNKDYLMVKLSKKISRDDVEETVPMMAPPLEEVDPTVKKVNIEITQDGEVEQDSVFEGDLGDEWLDMFEAADQEIEEEIDVKGATGELNAISSQKVEQEESQDGWGSMFDAADEEINQPEDQEGQGGQGGQGENWGDMFDGADQEIQPGATAGTPTAPTAGDEEDWGAAFDSADQAVKEEAGITAPGTPTAPAVEDEEDWGAAFDSADQKVKEEVAMENSVTDPATPTAEDEEDWGAAFDSADQKVKEEVAMENSVTDPAAPTAEDEEDWGAAFDSADQKVNQEAAMEQGDWNNPAELANQDLLREAGLLSPDQGKNGDQTENPNPVENPDQD